MKITKKLVSEVKKEYNRDIGGMCPACNGELGDDFKVFHQKKTDLMEERVVLVCRLCSTDWQMFDLEEQRSMLELKQIHD